MRSSLNRRAAAARAPALPSELFERLEDRRLLGADGPSDGSRPIFSSPDPYRATEFSDLDGDGDNDLIVSAGPRIYTRLNNGNAFFTQVKVFRISGRGTDIATGDWNGDGLTDLAVFGQGTGSSSLLRVFLGNGEGLFTRTKTIKLNGVNHIEAGNFDTDARDELLVVSDTQARVYQMNNGKPNAPRTILTTTGAFTRPAVADINGDDVDDFVLGNNGDAGEEGGIVEFALMSAAPTLGFVSFEDNARVDSVALGHVLGDAAPDLVVTGKGLESDASARFSVQAHEWNGTGFASPGVEIYDTDATENPAMLQDIKLSIVGIGEFDAGDDNDIAIRRLEIAPGSGGTVFRSSVVILRNPGLGVPSMVTFDMNEVGNTRPDFFFIDLNPNQDNSKFDVAYWVSTDVPGSFTKLRFAQNGFETI